MTSNISTAIWQLHRSCSHVGSYTCEAKRQRQVGSSNRSIATFNIVVAWPLLPGSYTAPLLTTLYRIDAHLFPTLPATLQLDLKVRWLISFLQTADAKLCELKSLNFFQRIPPHTPIRSLAHSKRKLPLQTDPKHARCRRKVSDYLCVLLLILSPQAAHHSNQSARDVISGLFCGVRAWG